MKVTKNTFFKGRNTDQDPSILDPSFYTEAHNVELVGAGTFFALQNIKGTTDVTEVVDAADTEILAVLPTIYEIAGTADKKCLTIITATDGGNFVIYCYDIDGDVLYKLFEEATTADYFTDDRIIDAEGYAERGLDVIYFTDNYNEIRQLRCQITTAQAATPTVAFLSAYDLSLQKRGANGRIALEGVNAGEGSLLSGSYQFAYRMIDPTTSRSTKWSSLTLPVTVSQTETPENHNISYAGIGLYTDKAIEMDIRPTQDELNNFDYFQVAVVENIYPSGADDAFSASLLPIEAVADYFVTDRINDYVYSSNTRVGTIPISELTVDVAPIRTAKTLNIDRNRLYAANLKYWDRTYDHPNGDPVITSGAVDYFSVNQWQDGNTKSYMRGEVYRFAIVYEDAFGNKSAPKVLDLSGVTDNMISSGVDMKFPTRADNNNYSVMSNDTAATYLQLNLSGIKNHPTWAVAFEIVRAKRIPRVLFQTPLIPMTYIEGIGTLRDYPTRIRTANDDYTDHPDAEPMTASKVYIPKNLLWPKRRVIRSISSSEASFYGANRVAGESMVFDAGTYDFGIIFPPNIYGEEYVPTGSESVETVDFCLLLASGNDYTRDNLVQGDTIYTSCSYTFHPRSANYYYYGPGHVKTAVDETAQIVDYAYFDNLSSGGTIGGEKVLQYSELSTKGLDYGHEPTVSKMGVVKLSDRFNDEGGEYREFPTLTHNSGSTNGTFIVGASGPQYQAGVTNITTKFVTEYTGYTADSPVQVVRIVNVVNNAIGDNRYGDPDTQHEFISTGTRRVFTTSELTDVRAGTELPIDVAVLGGDIFVSEHTFKVCDSTYTVPNQVNVGTNISVGDIQTNWGRFYKAGERKLSLPVAVENAGQFLQVCLENTYKGRVMEKDVIDDNLGLAYKAVLTPGSEASIRAPLTYGYNNNLSKENDQKVYFPLPEINFIQNVFKSRGIYSDQKIYNTSESGFDTFRVLNTFDLEESGGGITALVKDGDKFYAIQEKRISYLPTGQTVLEQTDANTLAVGTSDVIGRISTIDPKRGSQHLGGIVETGSSVYIVDNNNKAIYRLQGQQLEFISAMGNDVKFREMLDDSVPEKNILSIYDPTRKEYWFVDNANHECHVFSEVLDSWIANYEFSETAKLTGGAYADQKLYLMGNVSDQHSLFTMYDGDVNQLFGETVVPRVTFVVNPDSDFAKTFDDQAFVATNRLSTVDWEVEREDSLGNQTVSGTVLDVPSVEGNYRIKTLRDNLNARLRGLRLTTTVKWKNTLSKLSSVITKYRPSSRNPF